MGLGYQRYGNVRRFDLRACWWPDQPLTYMRALRGIVDGCAAYGDGRQVENPEPRQSLHSWAEFLAEEPVKPKGRSGKPQPAAASFFEWAFSLEQEREGELVGAGR